MAPLVKETEGRSRSSFSPLFFSSPRLKGKLVVPESLSFRRLQQKTRMRKKRHHGWKGGRGDAPERDDEKIRLVTGLRPLYIWFSFPFDRIRGKQEFFYENNKISCTSPSLLFERCTISIPRHVPQRGITEFFLASF